EPEAALERRRQPVHVEPAGEERVAVGPGHVGEGIAEGAGAGRGAGGRGRRERRPRPTAGGEEDRRDPDEGGRRGGEAAHGEKGRAAPPGRWRGGPDRPRPGVHREP